MKILLWLLLFPLMVVVFGLLMAFPTMLLWDALMPSLFRLREVTLLEAWGLNVLCGLLFKSQSTAVAK